MISVFGAPIDPAGACTMVDDLTCNYGDLG